MHFDFRYMLSLFAMPEFWRASLTVVELSARAWLIAAAAGFLLATARLSGWRALSVFASVYIWLFRSLPLMVLIVFVYNLPQLLPHTGGVLSNPFNSALIALVLTETAYMAEIHRGALMSVAKGQYEAATALGIRWVGAQRLVIIPQALRIALPTLGNQFISCVKLTSLASAISLSELLLVGERLYAQNFLVMETLLACAIYYVLIVSLFTWLMQLGECHMNLAARKPGMLSDDETSALRRAQAAQPARAAVQQNARGAAPALLLNGVQKRYGEHLVLKGIDLDVKAGEVLSIIGPSGSGKTSLIRTVNALEWPDGGEIVLFGRAYLSARDRPGNRTVRHGVKHIGMVFQSFNLFPHRTILENVTLAPRYHRRGSRAELDARALTLLDKVGLLAHAHKYPHQLSGGQQQRVAIARALAMEPDVMLFDEPTSALDPELVDDVLNVIRDLANEGMTMVVVTHEMDFAMSVSNRIAFMECGVVQLLASPDEIRRSPDAARVRRFIGIDDAPVRAVVAECAA